MLYSCCSHSAYPHLIILQLWMKNIAKWWILVNFGISVRTQAIKCLYGTVADKSFYTFVCEVQELPRSTVLISFMQLFFFFSIRNCSAQTAVLLLVKSHCAWSRPHPGKQGAAPAQAGKLQQCKPPSGKQTTTVTLFNDWWKMLSAWNTNQVNVLKMFFLAGILTSQLTFKILLYLDHGWGCKDGSPFGHNKAWPSCAKLTQSRVTYPGPWHVPVQTQLSVVGISLNRLDLRLGQGRWCSFLF